MKSISIYHRLKDLANGGVFDLFAPSGNFCENSNILQTEFKFNFSDVQQNLSFSFVTSNCLVEIVSKDIVSKSY